MATSGELSEDAARIYVAQSGRLSQSYLYKKLQCVGALNSATGCATGSATGSAGEETRSFPLDSIRTALYFYDKVT